MGSENDRQSPSASSLRASVAPAPGGDHHAIMRDILKAEDALEERREAWALECAARSMSTRTATTDRNLQEPN